MTDIINLNNYKDPGVRKLLALGAEVDDLVRKYFRDGDLELHEVAIVIAQRLSVLTPSVTINKEAYVDVIIELLIQNGGFTTNAE